MKKRSIFTLLAFVLCLFCALTLSAEKVKLTVWAGDIPDDSPDHAYAKAVVEGFQAKYPDIELDYVGLGNNAFKDKLKVTMASGSGLPDVFQTWGGSVMGGYADAGMLLDLTKELKDVPGSAAAASAVTWKGKIYGVAPLFAIAGLFVNEGIFAANGLKVPTSVEDLEKVCAALKAKGIVPFACGEKDKWPGLAMYMYLTNRFGGDASAKAAARKLPFDAEPFVKAGQLYQKWVKAGYFGETPLGDGYGDAQQQMYTGKAAMMVSGTWLCGNFASADLTDQKIGFYAFPALAKGGVGKVTDVMGMTDIGYAASKAGASKKDAVVKFLKYAMSPESVAADPGRIVAVPGVKAKNPITGMASVVFGNAKTVTFWWDQDLPPSVTSPLNDTIQTFFLADKDPKAELSKYEALCVENMGKIKK
jgi:raffinose/stachyose/melibiose transport system substrate-binding protein